MIGMFVGVDQYIQSKDNRLRNEIHETIDSLFNDRPKFVDVASSGDKVGYERVKIPSKPKTFNLQDEESKQIIRDLDKKSQNAWTETYSGLYSRPLNSCLSSDIQ